MKIKITKAPDHLWYKRLEGKTVEVTSDVHENNQGDQVPCYRLTGTAAFLFIDPEHTNKAKLPHFTTAFGRMLKEVREAHGLSKKDLAVRVKLHFKSIHNYEYKGYRPSKSARMKLYAFFKEEELLKAS